MINVRSYRRRMVSAEGHEEEWMGCRLEDQRAIGIQTNQWMITAQDCAKQSRVECFMTWIAQRESELQKRCEGVCMLERDGKDQRKGIPM